MIYLDITTIVEALKNHNSKEDELQGFLLLLLFIFDNYMAAMGNIQLNSI